MLKAKFIRTHRERRGIILIVILAMLGLFATIGILAAVLSKVEGAGARNFKRADQAPSLTGETQRLVTAKGTFDAKGLLSEAISQLAFDTKNPQSALRGHSLLRSMYGGPDAEPRPAGLGFPYYGAFNGTGHFAPRDYSSYPPVADPAIGITATSFNGSEGVIDAAKVKYALFRLRPPGNPANWSTLWNMTPTTLLEPVLPFNYTVFDSAGSTALARPATTKIGPPAAPEDPQPEKFWDGTNWHYFAKDVDYTAADYNNWFLALERGDGTIIQPSFHRPHLIAQLQQAGMFDDNNKNPWLSKFGRNIILRPRAAEYRAVDITDTNALNPGVRFKPPLSASLGQIWNDLPNLDGSVLPGTTVPIYGDSPAELDVDTDGDGKKDAIWIDLGVTKDNWVRLPDGGLAKPMFAFKVISMDGKINLNTAGNYRNMLDERGTTVTNRPIHGSNLGASPTEINPKHAFLLDETLTTASGGTGPRIPNWNNPGFYTWLLFGRLDSPGNPQYGRWNDSTSGSTLEQPIANPTSVVLPTMVAASNGIGIGPGACTANANLEENLPANNLLLTLDANRYLRQSAQIWGPFDQMGFGSTFEPFSAKTNTLYPPTSEAFKDMMGLTINHPDMGTKADLPLAATTTLQPPLTENDLKLESSLQAIPYDKEVDRLSSDLTANEVSVKGKDTPFSHADIEKLLRYFDIDGSVQSTRLTQLLGEALNSRAADANSSLANFNERQYARNRMRHLFTAASWDLIHAGTPPVFPESNGAAGPFLPEDTSKQEATPTAPYRHNGRLGVGTAGFTNFANQVTGRGVEGFGATTQGNFGTRLPFEVRHGRRYNLNKLLEKYESDPAKADQQRSDMAEQIYVLLWLAVRPCDYYPVVPGNVNYENLNRTIAQLAVNIVDFIDPDDVMTRLVFPINPTKLVSADPNGWPDTGPLTPNATGSNVVFGFELPRVIINEAVAVRAARPSSSPTADRIWMWAELHNPWPRDANGSSPLDAKLATEDPMTKLPLQPIYKLLVNGGTGFTGECGFVGSDSPHGATPTATLLKHIVESKGGTDNYFVVGPSESPPPNSTDPDDPASLLATYVGPTAGTDNGSLNSKPIQFAANCMYQASAAPSTPSRKILFTLARLRNPFAAFDATTNPFVGVDALEITEGASTASGTGLYLVNGPTPVAEDQRHSRARKQPWQGESLNGTYMATAPYKAKDEYFLGVPLASTPIDSGFEESATAMGTANTLGSENVDINATAAYSSFPFLNRPLASPLELLSVRLYGSHFWPTAPSGTAGGEWRMRFTDDYEFYPVSNSSSGLPRVWRSRQTPWLMDSEFAPATPVNHPENAAPYNQIKIPNLHRFFELVECRSLLNGAIDPIADENAGFPSALGQTASSPVLPPANADSRIDPRRSRVAGKICLNTISDEEPFRALIDAPEAMPGTARPANFNTQGDLPTPSWYPNQYILDPFRRVYAAELVASNWNVSGGINFGGDPGLTLLASTAFDITRRQWGDSITNGLRAACVYPGRHPDDLVAGEMFRMFLLSRAGRDGILGTGDDKPFRGFSSDRLSDTILRRRNFRALDYPQNRATTVPADGNIQDDRQAEYQVSLHGQYVPRLFDPIGNPYNRPNAVGGTIDPVDNTQAKIDHKIELDNKFNFTASTPFPTTANDDIDYWMLEKRRNQLLAKVAGNSTTRSNVFAVWVTVGLFRVQAGSEALAVPLLNEEVGSNTGEQVRHRGFFIIDRTRMDHYDSSMIRTHSLDDDDMKKLVQHYTIIE